MKCFFLSPGASRDFLLRRPLYVVFFLSPSDPGFLTAESQTLFGISYCGSRCYVVFFLSPSDPGFLTAEAAVM